MKEIDEEMKKKNVKPFVGGTHGVISTKEPEEKPKPIIPYEIGKVYADVKVVKIRPDFERSVYFVYAERDADGAVIKRPKVQKDKVVGFQPKWGEETHSMTPEDFAEFVEGRKRTGFMLGTDYAL